MIAPHPAGTDTPTVKVHFSLTRLFRTRSVHVCVCVACASVFNLGLELELGG